VNCKGWIVSSGAGIVSLILQPDYPKSKATFSEAVRHKPFAISAELFLRPETTAETITLQVQALQRHVDGILVTDNQEGRLHLSPLAAASLVKAAGVDPIVQLSCRNRNRIALLAELLGATTLGITSLVLIRGNRVPEGFNPRPRAVFDLDANELISMASRITTDDCLPNLPELYVGCLITPHLPEPGWVPDKLNQKSAAGAQFAQTHICMDMHLLQSYMKHLVAAGIPRRLGIFVKLAVFSSAEDARWLRDSLPNNLIPDALIERLEQAADAEAEGVSIAAEQLQLLARTPGVSGAHLVATQNLATICRAIEQAGLGPQGG
jgi:methylenetetrahydrofolate reductase (NADPH)